jgi:hypothetical protein
MIFSEAGELAGLVGRLDDLKLVPVRISTVRAAVSDVKFWLGDSGYRASLSWLKACSSALRARARKPIAMLLAPAAQHAWLGSVSANFSARLSMTAEVSVR